jgi:hypothetical protein
MAASSERRFVAAEARRLAGFLRRRLSEIRGRWWRRQSANGYAEGAGDPHEVDVAAGHEENTGMSHGVRLPRVHNVVQACPDGGRRVTYLRKPCQPFRMSALAPAKPLRL